MRHAGVIFALTAGYILMMFAIALSWCRGFLPWVLLGAAAWALLR